MVPERLSSESMSRLIAEASAQADAAERAATNEMETALVRIQNDIAITRAENERFDR